jgi:hypothetical protein
MQARDSAVPVQILLLLVFLLCIGLLIAFQAGIDYQKRQPIGDIERRNIAIDYACSPAQNWRMMKLFCGSVPREERMPK